LFSPARRLHVALALEQRVVTDAEGGVPVPDAVLPSAAEETLKCCGLDVGRLVVGQVMFGG
jgi:hypothetical protein